MNLKTGISTTFRHFQNLLDKICYHKSRDLHWYLIGYPRFGHYHSANSISLRTRSANANIASRGGKICVPSRSIEWWKRIGWSRNRARRRRYIDRAKSKWRCLRDWREWEGRENRGVGDETGVVGELGGSELLPGGYGAVRSETVEEAPVAERPVAAVSDGEIVDEIQGVSRDRAGRREVGQSEVDLTGGRLPWIESVAAECGADADGAI